MKRLAAVLLAAAATFWAGSAWTGSGEGSGEGSVGTETLSRAVEAAIRELAREEGGPVVAESTQFLLSHSVASLEALRSAKARATGIHLIRIVSILETLERQYRIRKETRGSWREVFLAEPTLRILLGVLWIIATLLVVKAFRDHGVPHLEAYVRSKRIHIEPKTLSGIERLVVGLIALVGVNLGLILFVIQGLPVPEATRAYYNALRVQVANGLFFVACGYGFLKVVDVAFDSLKKRAEGGAALDARLVQVFRNGVKGTLIVGTLLLVLENLGLQTGFLHLAVGIFGVAVAFASRNTLANVFGALALAGGRVFQVGDRVQIDGLDGYIEAIGVQSTRLRTNDGTSATVPNAVLAAGAVTNLSRRPHTRHAFSVHLASEAPPARIERALELLRDILSRDEDVQDYWVHLSGVSPRGVELQTNLWLRTTDGRRVREAVEEILLEAKRRFDAEGITPLLASGP